MVKLVYLGCFYSSSPNIISKFREIIELTSSVIWPSANSLGSIECKPIPNNVKYLLCWHSTSSQTSMYPCNCCQTAMGGPCYFTHRFSSVLATVLNQCVKYFDISYFWLPVVSKQLVFTLFILLVYFYPIIWSFCYLAWIYVSILSANVWNTSLGKFWPFLQKNCLLHVLLRLE